MLHASFHKTPSLYFFPNNPRCNDQFHSKSAQWILLFPFFILTSIWAYLCARNSVKYFAYIRQAIPVGQIQVRSSFLVITTLSILKIELLWPFVFAKVLMVMLIGTTRILFVTLAGPSRVPDTYVCHSLSLFFYNSHIHQLLPFFTLSTFLYPLNGK